MKWYSKKKLPLENCSSLKYMVSRVVRGAVKALGSKMREAEGYGNLFAGLEEDQVKDN